MINMYGAEYIYVYQYKSNNEFLDIRNKLANAGFRLTIMIALPDWVPNYAVVFKYKNEYYIENDVYESIRHNYFKIIHDKEEFIQESIKPINNK